MASDTPSLLVKLWQRKSTLLAVVTLTGIITHVVLRFGFEAKPGTLHLPLLITLAIGGLPLLYDLLRKLLKGAFGSDLLGGVSIITSIMLGEYLAGSIIVLMLAGGEALESYALRSASSVLAALAKRMPSIAHRKTGADIADAALEMLTLVASLERYSKHPLSRAIHAAAKAQSLTLPEASAVSEQPGHGLRGTVSGYELQITSRNKLIPQNLPGTDQLPPIVGGLECVVVIDGHYAAALRFRDAPRAESRSFVNHLAPKHHFDRVMIISGDRESEVRYLADQVGITEIHAQKSPEEKLALVRAETAKARTLYVGDGINDAPAMMAATVGINDAPAMMAATVGMAIGQNSDVTAEAAGVVIMDNSLKKVDEFMHISRRMRVIALQSAVGGMALSLIGMAFAATGHLSPVSGAIAQEIIDVLAVLNALRAALPPRVIRDL